MVQASGTLTIFMIILLIVLILSLVFLTIYGINSPQQVSESLSRLRTEATLFQSCFSLPCASGLSCDPRTNTCKLVNGSECYQYNQCLSNSSCQGGTCQTRS